MIKIKYIGSKNRISKYIVPIIQEYVNNSDAYLEPFVGGANIIDKIKCKNKYACDINKYLIALLRKARDNKNDIPDTISKKEYIECRENKNTFPNWFVGLCGFCASYNAKWFGGYANNVKTKQGIRNYTDESIRNLKKQSKNLKNIKFKCCSYSDIPTTLKGYTIYCDPPYKDTYNYSIKQFDYKEFYIWCRKMAKNNTVLVSEYSMPEDFICIWSDNLICTLDKEQKINRTEKMFICERK